MVTYGMIDPFTCVVSCRFWYFALNRLLATPFLQSYLLSLEVGVFAVAVVMVMKI